MTQFAFSLVLVSTFMHAGWNLVARRRREEALTIRRALVLTAVVGFAPAVISELHVRSLTPMAWACAFSSGVCCGVYYLGLTRAYGSSDFTIVYPLARALPVLLVGFGDVLLGRYPTAPGWAGMVLVVAGCVLAPLSSFREMRLGHYANRATLWIILAAFGTVGYSLLDKAAAEVVRQGPATAARYGYVFFLTSGVTYGALLRLFGTGREQRLPVGWRAPVLAAILNFGAYWLVLWAYQMSRRASYVVAFRQFSIVIGVLGAFLLFRERGLAVRTVGTLLITAGLVLIALWGG
jgi:drug/metabolite transporter (DMT)-like permease